MSSSMHEQVPPVLTAAINELAQGQCARRRVEARIEDARDRVQRYLVELGDSVHDWRYRKRQGHDLAWLCEGETPEADDKPQPGSILEARERYCASLGETVDEYYERHGEWPRVELYRRRRFVETVDALVDYVVGQCDRVEPEEAIANYLQNYLGPRYSHLERPSTPVGEEIKAASADFCESLEEVIIAAGRDSVDAETRGLRRRGSSRIPPTNTAECAQDDVMRRFGDNILSASARFLALLYVHYVPTAFDCVDTSLPEAEEGARCSG